MKQAYMLFAGLALWCVVADATKNLPLFFIVSLVACACVVSCGAVGQRIGRRDPAGESAP